ncbi:MAG: hypothetical protein ABIQ10_04020 [Gemmatimonadaceae bacterium]
MKRLRVHGEKALDPGRGFDRLNLYARAIGIRKRAIDSEDSTEREEQGDYESNGRWAQSSYQHPSVLSWFGDIFRDIKLNRILPNLRSND